MTYKVAMITPDYPPNIIGGAGVSSEMLVRNLRSKGIHVDVFSFKTTQIKKEIRENPLGTDRYFKGSTNKVVQQIRIFNKLFFCKEKYDIYHIYNVTPLPAISFLKFFKRRIKTVATLNNHNLSCLNTLYALNTSCSTCSFSRSYKCVRRKKTGILKSLFKAIAFKISKKMSMNVDLLIGLTENMKLRYEIAGFGKTKYEIIPNAYDPAYFTNTVNVNSKSDHGPLVILYVGQLNYRKGATDLIKAFSMFDKTYLNHISLKIIGSGNEKSDIESVIKEHNLSEFVELKEVDYKELEQVYISSDIFVHPAKWLEPFSRTWLEAMGFGLPIISSNNPGAKEVLQDGALYFEVGDIGGLYTQLKELVDHKSKRVELIEYNNKNILQFNLDNVIDHIITAHKDLLKETHNE